MIVPMIAFLLCLFVIIVAGSSWRRRGSPPLTQPVLRGGIAGLGALMVVLLAFLVAPHHGPLAGMDWLFILIAILLGATGLYIIAEPRRLFMRAEDPAAYRPETVEYDSAQGVWLRKTYGPALLAMAVIFILTRIL